MEYLRAQADKQSEWIISRTGGEQWYKYYMYINSWKIPSYPKEE